MLAAIRDDLFRVGSLPLLEHYDGLDRFAPFLVGNAYDRALQDLRMREQHGLDLFGINVLAAADYHIELAIDEIIKVVLVHAREAENQFVAEGYGIHRRDVMYNDFVILGPKDDPAGIKGTKDTAEALKRVAQEQANFCSRGDDSGTHKKEKQLWKGAGIEPAGKWYMETGQGMGPTLTVADESGAYVLADRGTYLAFRDKIDLVVCCEGDEKLFNPYGIIQVNPKRHPHVKSDLARSLVQFITSPEGQKIIGGFEINGERLFHPNERAD